MSYLEYQAKYVPSGFRKLLHLNWPIIMLLTAVACAGFLMLYSVAGGRMEVWADPSLERNKHTVRVTSDSSDFTMSIQNWPSAENPATGKITAMSVIALLRQKLAVLQVGT